MALEVAPHDQEVRSVDIQTMYHMRPEEYREYLEDYLLYVDHHDYLMSRAAGYPIATTKAQFAALMSYLRELEPKVVG